MTDRMRHLLILVGLGLVLGLSGSAAALVDSRESDVPGSGVAAGQDIESVAITTAPVKQGDPPSTMDVTFTIKICLAACPSGTNKSIKIRIGGATILLSVDAFTWTYTITPKGGSPMGPTTLDTWDQEGYETLDEGGVWSTSLTRCCATITTSAHDLGLDGSPNSAVPTGKVAYTVSTHNSADGTGAAVDSAGPDRVSYSYP